MTLLKAIDLAGPAISRLSALAPLQPADIALLKTAMTRCQRIPARREFVTEGNPVGQAILMVSGWACRVRTLSDGRRQILSLFLPGDLICAHRERPIALATVLALTDVTICHVPFRAELEPGSRLGEAYGVSGMLDEAYLLAQITRLGRFSAYERFADLLLELHERLTLAGIAMDRQFPLPLTQEALADMLGLTSVHVNRTLQLMRREGTVTVGGGIATLHDVEGLAGLVDYRRARVA